MIKKREVFKTRQRKGSKLIKNWRGTKRGYRGIRDWKYVGSKVRKIRGEAQKAAEKRNTKG